MRKNKPETNQTKFEIRPAFSEEAGLFYAMPSEQDTELGCIGHVRIDFGRGGKISGGWVQNYGYVVETENYRYCLRCNPVPGDYQAYLTCFDKRVQEMNQETKTEEPEETGESLTMTMGGM